MVSKVNNDSLCSWQCICEKLKISGLPCSHIIKILKINKNEFSNALNLIDKRWILNEDAIETSINQNHIKILEQNIVNKLFQYYEATEIAIVYIITCNESWFFTAHRMNSNRFQKMKILKKKLCQIFSSPKLWLQFSRITMPSKFQNVLSNDTIMKANFVF